MIIVETGEVSLLLDLGTQVRTEFPTIVAADAF
jgi:hypothetical protein